MYSLCMGSHSTSHVHSPSICTIYIRYSSRSTSHVMYVQSCNMQSLYMVIVVGYHTYIVLEYVKFIYVGSRGPSHVRSPRICTVYIWLQSQHITCTMYIVLEYAQFIYGALAVANHMYVQSQNMHSLYMAIVVAHHKYIVLKYVQFIYGVSRSTLHVRSPRKCTVYIWLQLKHITRTQSQNMYSLYTMAVVAHHMYVSPRICTVCIWLQSYHITSTQSQNRIIVWLQK